MPYLCRKPRRATVHKARWLVHSQLVFSNGLICIHSGPRGLAVPLTGSMGLLTANAPASVAHLQQPDSGATAGQLMCRACYETCVAPDSGAPAQPVCAACGRVMKNSGVSWQGQAFHPDCFACCRSVAPRSIGSLLFTTDSLLFTTDSLLIPRCSRNLWRKGVEAYNLNGSPCCGECLEGPLQQDIQSLNVEQDIQRVKQDMQLQGSPVDKLLHSLGIPAECGQKLKSAGVVDLETLGFLSRDDLTDRVGLPLGYAAKIINKLGK